MWPRQPVNPVASPACRAPGRAACRVAGVGGLYAYIATASRRGNIYSGELIYINAGRQARGLPAWMPSETVADANRREGGRSWRE